MKRLSLIMLIACVIPVFMSWCYSDEVNVKQQLIDLHDQEIQKYIGMVDNFKTFLEHPENAQDMQKRLEFLGRLCYLKEQADSILDICDSLVEQIPAEDDLWWEYSMVGQGDVTMVILNRGEKLSQALQQSYPEFVGVMKDDSTYLKNLDDALKQRCEYIKKMRLKTKVLPFSEKLQ